MNDKHPAEEGAPSPPESSDDKEKDVKQEEVNPAPEAADLHTQPREDVHTDPASGARPEESFKTQGSENPAETRRRFGWVLKTVEILFTATVAAALTVFTTVYLQKHSLPVLTIDYAWCMAVTDQLPTKKNEFITFLVDLQTQAIVRDTAYKVVIEPKKGRGFDFTPNHRSYIGKVIVANNGTVTANNVRIGVGYMYLVDMTIKVSPNVRATLVNIDPATVYDESHLWPLRREIQIEDIPPNEKAFITISWTLDPTVKDSLGRAVETNHYYVPEILYISSKESLGKIRDFIPYKVATETQGNSISDTAQPFWKVNINVHKDATMTLNKITDRDKIGIEVEFSSPPPRNPSAPTDRREQ